MDRPAERPLPAKVLERWDAWYDRHIASAATDEEELQRLREVRERAEAGFTLTESGDEARVGRPRWTVATVEALAGKTAAPAADANRKRLALALIAGLCVAMCVILIVILSPVLAPKRTAAAQGQTTPGALPTAAPVLVEVNGQRLALDAPRSLELAGVVMQVVPGEVTTGGGLKYPRIDEHMVVWFPSPANWLVAADVRVVNALDAGQVIVGRTATGRVLRFVVDDVLSVPPQAVEALAQGRAGLVVFPLLSTGESVRVVSARYDPTSEQPGTLASGAITATAALSQPVHLADAQLIVTGALVERRQDGLYEVTVQHVATGTLPPAMLSIDGQLYPQLQGLAARPGGLAFYVASLGEGELVVSERRIALGLLEPPRLVGQIDGVETREADLVVSVTIMATRGSGYVLPGDVTLLTGTRSQPASEVAPLGMTPAEVYVAPGLPARVEITFARPADQAVRVRLFDTLWEITGLSR